MIQIPTDSVFFRRGPTRDISRCGCHEKSPGFENMSPEFCSQHKRDAGPMSRPPPYLSKLFDGEYIVVLCCYTEMNRGMNYDLLQYANETRLMILVKTGGGLVRA